MGFVFRKKDLTVNEAKILVSESQVVQKLSYIEIKKKVQPKKFSMVLVDENTFTVPYKVALDRGYRRQNFEQYHKINNIVFRPGRNICKMRKDENHRPFVGEFRDYQTDVINQLLDQLEEHFTTTLGLFPGWGKTMGTSYLMWRLGLRTIIFSPLKKVTDGWKKTFETFLPHFVVWVVGEGPCPENVDIILCPDRQFEKIPVSMRSTIGTLVADEAHMLCTDTRVRTFLSFDPLYVIMISATMNKANGYEQMAHLMAGNHGVYIISTKPYDLYIVDTGVEVEEEYGEQGAIIGPCRKNISRNAKIQDIVCNILMMNCEHHKIMCVRMVKEGIPAFVNKVRECGITCDSMFGNKDDYLNSQVLVLTQQKGGTGFDEANACKDFDSNPTRSNMMIFEHTTPTPDIFEQTRGRVMRSENPIILMMRHRNGRSPKHIADLAPWFKKTNARVRVINFWEAKIPGGEQIYERDYNEQSFYKVLSKREMDIFWCDKILERNQEDQEEEGHRVFLNKETAIYHSHKNKNFEEYILKIKYSNVVKVSAFGEKKYYCISPICQFNARTKMVKNIKIEIETRKIESLDEIEGEYESITKEMKPKKFEKRTIFATLEKMEILMIRNEEKCKILIEEKSMFAIEISDFFVSFPKIKTEVFMFKSEN